MTDDSVSSLEGSEERFSLAAPEEEGYVKTAAYNYSKSSIRYKYPFRQLNKNTNDQIQYLENHLYSDHKMLK